MDMSPIPGSWEFASLVCKLLFYFAAASSLGGSFSLWLYSDGSRKTVTRVLQYQLLGGLLGFHGVIAYFLIQVGQINDSGPLGALDWSMAQILLDTSLGDLSLFRLVGFTFIAAAALLSLGQSRMLNNAPGSRFYQTNILGTTLGFLLLLYSFRFGGHVSVLGPPVQLSLIIHFVCFSLWIGALWPLHHISAVAQTSDLQLILKRFGDHAVFVVSALLIAGVLMLINLIQTPQELLQTNYGRSLLLKLLLVIALLAIAAINKLVLVPALAIDGSSDRFRKSVRIEMFVATLLLLVTAYLSTIVGPMSHEM